MHKIIIFFYLFSLNAYGNNFFATKKIQQKYPNAFILQSKSRPLLEKIMKESFKEADLLITAIKRNKSLMKAIKNWEVLTIKEQIPHLKVIFELEYKSLKISPPKLVIGDELPRAAFFEFNSKIPSTGTVYLNPKILEKYNKYESLALLIHETRHSAQFQLAFNHKHPIHAKNYHAAFHAQEELSGKLGFCDFLTLNNEFEAFLFGNYVLGKLTNWKVNLPSMGTYASQFDKQGNLKLDLLELIKKYGENELLDIFNKHEEKQYREIKN